MNWTDDQIEKLKSRTRPHGELAKEFGCSEAAIRGKRQRLGVTMLCDDRKAPAVKPTTLEEDAARARGEHWKVQFDALRSKYETLLKHNTATAQLVDMVAELAPRSYDSAPPVKQVSRGNGSPQTAVLFLSDCHIGQVVTPEQTLGKGLYNFQVFLARLKFLEEGVISILRDHTTTKIDELVLCIGGDILDGALDHGSEAAHKNTLFAQWYSGGHALAQFIRNLAPHVPSIRVQCVVGNHPRFPNQKRMPTDNRFSNLDHFLSAYIQALTAGIPNVGWTLNQQPFSLFKVYDFLLHLSHGEHLRGGDKALGIPNHSVARMVSSTSQLFGKDDEPAPHLYLVGHLHREISLPHARGSVIVNGAFVGLDSYGLAGGFSPVSPSQSFFFMHKKYGVTARYNLQLKFAEVTAEPPYTLPNNFPCQ